MSLDLEISKSKSISQWLDGAIHGIEFERSTRSMLAAACFDSVGEIHKGVVVLLYDRLNAPAFALARPAFETYLRGVWLSHSASEADLGRFQRDKIDPTIQQVITSIEKIAQFSDGVLSRVKAAGFDVMSSYTHGGFYQISRRIGPDFIEPHYAEEEQVEILRATTSYSLLSAIEIANLAQNEALAESVLQQIIEYAHIKA